MKYKIGDLVKVVNSSVDTHGQIGKIVDIDEHWAYPYEVEFENKSYNDVLFTDSDLSKVIIEENGDIKEELTPRDFINIKFQEGVVSENGINGAQIEDVIDVLVERLQSFQNGKFPCRENALAITHLQEAQNWLWRRTKVREERGIEGKNINHE